MPPSDLGSSWQDLEEETQKLLEEETQKLLRKVDLRSRKSMVDAVFRKRDPHSHHRQAASPRVKLVNTSAADNTPDSQTVIFIIYSFIIGILTHTLEVASFAIRLMKRPLAVALFIWIITLVFASTVGSLTAVIRAAFAPLCTLPLLCRLQVCTGDLAKLKWADYPQLIKIQNRALEPLLEESMHGPGLSLEIKMAEMASADLATLMRASNLNSREVLADLLMDFVGDARKAGRGLLTFNSKVNGALDSILAVNDYAVHAIKAAQQKHKTWSLWQIGFGHAQVRDSSGPHEVVKRTFADAMEIMSVNMRRLIVQAEISLADLDQLEQRLYSFAEVLALEDSTLVSQRQVLLTELWTRLGGNGDALRGVEEHITLLKNVNVYRQRAMAHVVAALQTLSGMSVDMEELRARVAAPDLVGESIPVDVHIKSITAGLERLRAKRIRAKEQKEETYLINRVD